jgi:hypothetical protein
MLVCRMHLSLLISIVALGVATASYLRANRVERDQRHLRRRFQKELHLLIRAQRQTEDQSHKAEEGIASVAKVVGTRSTERHTAGSLVSTRGKAVWWR